jgi:hypothetical protein
MDTCERINDYGDRFRPVDVDLRRSSARPTHARSSFASWPRNAVV